MDEGKKKVNQIKQNADMLKDKAPRGSGDTKHHHQKFNEFMKKIDLAEP